MTNQFTLTDLVRVAEAFAAFSLVVVAPGYVAAWLLDLLEFRRRAILTRCAIAVPVSIGICPVISYLLWRFAPPAVVVFYAGSTLGFVALLVKQRRDLLSAIEWRKAVKRDGVFIGIVLGWIALAAGAMVDLQIGHRLYFPTITYDYSLRTMVVAAISRAGVPAQNPFFFPGRTFVMHYHYFWLILCSIAERITGSTVTARHAVIAGTIWCGIGLMSAIALYVRFFRSQGELVEGHGEEVRRRTLWCIGLLAVTGLDVIPVLIVEFLSGGYFAEMEWWNEQVAAWITTTLWVPHNIAGLVACLTGFLIAWHGARQPDWQKKAGYTVLAGIIFASAVGLAIYVTLVFAAFMGVWMVVDWLRKRRDRAAVILFSGVVTICFSLPFLAELTSPGSGVVAGSAGIPLKFTVRSFRFFDSAFGLTTPGLRTYLADLFILPLNYFLELGFFLVAGIAQVRRMWKARGHLDDEQLCTLCLATVSILICTFVSSAVVSSNDLGWRGFLPAQFVLLLWAGELLQGGYLARVKNPLRQNQRALLLATLVLGVAGSGYALFKIRFYPLLSDATTTPLYAWLAPDRDVGGRTYAVRQIYDELRRITPASAVFQHNPNTAPEDLFSGVYGDRQVAAEGMTCGVAFGGDEESCRSRIGLIDALFERPGDVAAADIDGICGRLSINWLVVKDTDKAWKDGGSWVWKRRAVLGNAYARAYSCGSGPVRLP